MVGSLGGWEIVTVVIVSLIAITGIVILLIVRKDRSRKLRVGVFVERDYEVRDDERRPDGDLPSD